VLRILGGFKEKPIHFVLNGETFIKNILLMTISNGSTFGGGFILNPSAETDDGLLDICLINEIPAWLRFWHVPKLKTGAHTRIKESEFYRAEHLKIDESSDLVAHLDGEYIGHPPFDISIKKGVLPIRVPA
jgi:diacylglycerol kinase family enzyme